MESITEKQYYKGGYAKVGLTGEQVRTIKARVSGTDGKVYQGQQGLRLKNKMLEKQKYYARNRNSNSY